MLSRLLRHQSGSAAAEMAMVTPLLIALMLGSMELGHYYYSEHVVLKAVRDGARYASRQGFTNYTCPNTINATVVDNTRRVTRTNQVAAGGSSRLADWTQDTSITVTARCDTSGTYGAFYDGLGGVPVVRVSATVPYTSLFTFVGINFSGMNLNAWSEAPVMGL